MLALVPKNSLLILDRGFYDFKFFVALVEQQGAAFITQLKSNAKIEVVKVLTQTDTVKDLIVVLGSGQNDSPSEEYNCFRV